MFSASAPVAYGGGIRSLGTIRVDGTRVDGVDSVIDAIFLENDGRSGSRPHCPVRGSMVAIACF